MIQLQKKLIPKVMDYQVI